ncbi:hypothetical protein NDK47_08830 [Brevibacillus ruminantium]|uniref:MerR family transcriptional regulator n=1 Tax=Brevibacillus ruminantium TaxID=2950604 RepID=A0ABY4WML0_9BACL|nr:hypothetical protein [Brevibacillus ruminantium]USG67358.1 hypothetical protein NDK47_08830 [Brevibacillus ruminantium]
MERYYTLSTISRKLSASNKTQFVTEDTVWKWVKQGILKAERVPDNVVDWGKYPYWVEETQLQAVLQSMGYDISLFCDKAD